MIKKWLGLVVMGAAFVIGGSNIFCANTSETNKTETVKPQTPEAAKPGDTQMDTKEQAKKTIARLEAMPIDELYTKFVDLTTMEVIDFDTVIKRLEGIQVVYVAESHTNQKHHDLQLKVLEALAEKNPKTTLAMEFLYRSKQPVIDEYAAGKLTEKEFETKVKDGFGGWYHYYQPLIRYAGKNSLNIVGLNVERQIKQKMADQGWDKLTKEEQKLIAKDIDTSNKAHREYVMSMFKGMMRAMGPIKDESMLDRFYLMQCIWDETFGEAIANYLKAANDPKVQVVVVAGNGHISYKFNIPDRSYKRYPAPFKTLIPIEVNSVKDIKVAELLTSGVGDFVYFSPVTTE